MFINLINPESLIRNENGQLIIALPVFYNN